MLPTHFSDLNAEINYFKISFIVQLLINMYQVKFVIIKNQIISSQITQDTYLKFISMDA